MSNEHVHPIFQDILAGLVIPYRPMPCPHPDRQINDEGICCDCGANVRAVSS